MAFSKEVRRQIKNSEAGKSIVDHFGRTECAHYDHDRSQDHYNDPSNGREVNLAEHYMEHLICAREGIDNGLTIEQNQWAAEQIWNRMNDDEKAYIIYISRR